MRDTTPPRIQTQIPRWGINYAAGYIGFCAEDTHSALSVGIAYLTRDGGPVAVSHVLVVTGPDECVEALPQGVSRSRLQPYFDNPRPLFLRPFVGYTPELGARVAANALKLEGLPYGNGLIATNLLAGCLAGRAANGAFNLAADALGLDCLRNLPNRAVSYVADANGLAPVCSVVAAECLHPVEPAVRARGLVEVLGPLGCLSCPRIVTPQMLFDDSRVIA